MANEISIDVVAKLDKIESQLAGLEKKAQESGDQVGKSLGENLTGSITKSFLGIGAAIGGIVAAAAGLGELKHFLEGSVEEAINAEIAVNDFNSALRVSGKFTQEASKDFQDYADSLQQITTADDDAIISNSALLVSIGQLSGQGLKDATKAALDLAAGTGRDLGTAFEVVAKAASGNTEILGRYGVNLAKGIPESEKFAAALEQINTKFGGLAEAKVNTFGGAIDQLKNIFNNFKQAIGDIIVQSPVLISLIKEVGKIFLEATQSVKTFGSSGDIIGNLIKSLLNVGTSITTYVIYPLEILYNTGKSIFLIFATGLSGIAAGFGIIADGISFVLSGLVNLGQGLAFVVSSFDEELANKISAGAQNISDSIKKVGTDIRTGSQKIFVDLANSTSDSFTNTFDDKVSTGLLNFIDRFKIAANSAEKISKKAGEAIKDNVSVDIPVPKTDDMEKKLLDFNQKILNAQKSRIDEELRIATDEDARNVLFAEKKQFLELDTQQKINELRLQAEQLGLQNSEAYRLATEQIIQTKNANVIALENQLNQKQIELGQSVSKVFQQGVANALATGIATIGTSLVKGLKAFDNLGKKLLSIAGDLAIQIGTMILTTALATQALATGPFAAASAIPWAIGLIALGGVLKALGEGGGEGGGVVGQGAGGAGAAGGVGGAGGPGGPETQGFQAGTSVVVNVQGNILDRRETGLELANIIRENFDTNAVSIPAGASI